MRSTSELFMTQKYLAILFGSSERLSTSMLTFVAIRFPIWRIWVSYFSSLKLLYISGYVHVVSSKFQSTEARDHRGDGWGEGTLTYLVMSYTWGFGLLGEVFG